MRLRGVPGQVDGRDEEDLVGAHALAEEVGDPGDLRVLQQLGQGAGPEGGRDGLAGEEVGVASDQEERDDAQQDTDDDRPDRVVDRIAVSWWVRIPAKATTRPTRAAASSKKTARSVGLEVSAT